MMDTLTTARVRRNYWLCQAQLDSIYASGCQPRHAAAARTLREWQDAYLDELVRRGVRC